MPATRAHGEGTPCPIQRTGGIDWYRAIINSTNGINAARDVADAIQQWDIGRGSAVRPWRFVGYEGRATSSLRWGVRGHKWLWETSGAAAPSFFHRMVQCGGRTTRLDVQTTIVLSAPHTALGSSLMSSSTPTSRLPSLRTKKVGRASDSRGLWCGTVGERTDPSYWRVYDKGVESRTAPPGLVWRVELEAKKSLAPKLVEEACRAENVPSWCEQRVRSSWKQAGFSWPWPEHGQHLPPVRPDARKPPDAIALMQWLATSVAPTIPRVLNVFTVSELLRALGLDGQAIPRGSDSADPDA